MDTSDIADAFDTAVDNALTWVSDNGTWLFDGLRALFEGFYDAVLWLLTVAPWPALTILLGIIAWRVLGRVAGLLTALGLAICWAMGLWPETMDTFALVITATADRRAHV